MNKKGKLALAWIGAFGLSLASLIFQCYCYTKLWVMIAVPMGLPEITKLQAYGISFLVGFFLIPSLAQRVEKEKDDLKSLLMNSFYRIIGAIVSLGMAYLVFRVIL